ncbi:MAG TPA: organomercurial lyase [Candidatus Binatia bacterium]|nr:organomercurial lyase [Candidatus Binatia bacterium]
MSADRDLIQRIRKRIFDHFLEHASPPVVEQLMVEFSLSRDDAGDALRQLEAARHIALVKDTDRVLMAFPFSAIATPFRATVGGRGYFANCAWDAIAFHSMLKDDVRVDSFCHHCATSIRIDLAEGRTTRVEPPEAIIYLALPPRAWWDDIITTCSNTMVFFASPEHRDASALCASADRAASLTPDQVHELSQPIYPHKLELDYTRPSRDELLAHFASMGLTGDYWRL